jgi:uncharacterized membrane protein YfcA
LIASAADEGKASVTVENKAWYIAIGIWLAGAAVLYWLWHSHFANDVLDTIFGFVLYLIAFFYFLALFPIRERVARWLRR